MNWKPYAAAALCIAMIASGWFARSWYEDSVALAIHETKAEISSTVATAIASQKVENKIVYNKTVERINTDVQYKECRADAEMMSLTNRAIMGGQ